MTQVPGAQNFRASGTAYDRFMGRYSRALAPLFADAAGLGGPGSGATAPVTSALDVGCGPGALTEVLVARLGAGAVGACDPSESFLAAVHERCPGVDVRPGSAEALPFADAAFDAALAQLVLHFVHEPDRAGAELRRVVRPGGVVAACSWDFAEQMQLLRSFWDAALAVRPDAPDEAQVLRFGRRGEIADLFSGAGLRDVAEGTLQVESTYVDFAELWSGFLLGIGPAGAFCVGLPEAERDAVRAELFARLGAPAGPITMSALARYAVGRVPARST